MVIAKKWVIAQHFNGEPKPSDLTIVEEKLPPLKSGEFLIKAVYLSVDPYMRFYGNQLELGTTMIGSQIAEVVTSKNREFLIGKFVFASVGWRTYTILDENQAGFYDQTPYVLPDFDGLSLSLGLGVLGMPGNSAYFPVIEILRAKAGETLVVSGAAGAVGSHVGQIGKIRGLKVIGIAGSDAKCKWLKEELGFDHAINYKTQDVKVALQEAAPERIDCYFDNVGGDISDIVMNQMNIFGRVAVCGFISAYNAEIDELPTSPIVQIPVLMNQLKLEGFVVFRWNDRWFEGIEQNLQWVKEKKLKYRETVTEGFENMFDAFIGVLNGENSGKAIVKV